MARPYAQQQPTNDHGSLKDKCETFSSLDSGIDSMNMSEPSSMSDDLLKQPMKQENLLNQTVTNCDSGKGNSMDSSKSCSDEAKFRPQPAQALDSNGSSGYVSYNSSNSASSASSIAPKSSDNTEVVDKPLNTPMEDKPPMPFNNPDDFQSLLRNLVLSLCLHWTKWTIKHFKDNMSEAAKETANNVFWDSVDDEDGDFEALNAARDGDENVVAFAVYTASHHRKLNTANKDRQTVLHVAAEFCSAQLVRLIVTRGADGAIPDVYGDTALHIAARAGRADVVEALSLTLTRPEVQHPFYKVPYKSLPQDNVQCYNHDGRTPVHLAAETPFSEKHRDALGALAKHSRADLDYRRLGDGYSPSHIAIDNGDYECLKVCLQGGADSEVRNYKSETPQQLAYLCGYTNMVELCQEYGAGAYQLDYARTEPVDYSSDEEDMDADDEEPINPHQLSNQMEQMAVH